MSDTETPSPSEEQLAAEQSERPPATPPDPATWPPRDSASGVYGSPPPPLWSSGTTEGTQAMQGMYSPPPSYFDYMPAPARRPRRNRWAYALVVLALLVAVALGAAVGALVASARGSTPAAITIGSSSAPVVQTSASASTLQQNVESVVQAVQPSVVEITSTSGQQEAIGSGDILSANGYIVTNDHVVQGYSSFTVTLSNGKSQSAQIVGQDPQDDLAVLKINASNLHPIAIANSSNVKVGAFAIALGNPLGLQQSATFGIVSALNRSASEAPSGPAAELTGLIQTSAPINPGNSGGALVNLQGQLIGIPTLGAVDPETGTAANGIGYAIPANRVSYVAQQLIQHGQLTSSGQGFLGIEGEDVTPQLASANGLSVQSGVLIAAFANDAANASPAQQAGLQVGDIITAVNGTAINNSSDLSAALLTQQPGTKVTLTVVRGSSTRTVTVTLGERPANTQG